MASNTTALLSGHTVQLLEGGRALFPALVEAIDASRVEVRMETYIFSFEAAGELVAGALERAAGRGVRVFLMMDGFGTPHVPALWVARFDAAGVQWQQFSMLGRWGLLASAGWRRLHRKLCVVDAQIGFCGGINILDDYIDPSYGVLESPRYDFALRIVGPLVADIHTVLLVFWKRFRITRQIEDLRFSQARETWQASPSVVAASASREREQPGVHGVSAALVLRDNVRNRKQIERAYRKAIAEAREEVIIANAYFLPGRKLRTALIHAARRGVWVRLLLQGRYEYFMQYHGARPVFGVLLAAGVQIHEYASGFLHAKVAVIDNHWVTVGSSNLDPLSLLLAREANIVVDNVQIATALRTNLLQAMETQGEVLDVQAYANRPLRQRILDRLALGVMRLLLWLTGRSY